MLLQIQNTVSNIIKQLPSEVGISLLTTYKRHEFEFDYDSCFKGCEYDVQWEDLRLTFEVGEVHNDYLANVTIKRNAVNPGQSYPQLKVEDKFNEISEWNLHFKINSIVRTKPQSGVKEYQIYLVLKRRRW